MKVQEETKKNDTRKFISWSYPTSDNAKKFGFYKTGCWTVETTTDNKPPIAIAGYATKEEAKDHYNSLPYSPTNWYKEEE